MQLAFAAAAAHLISKPEARIMIDLVRGLRPQLKALHHINVNWRGRDGVINRPIRTHGGCG